jgi:hypothetical protein
MTVTIIGEGLASRRPCCGFGRHHVRVSQHDDVHLVVPTRAERADYLDISIQSILRQTHPVRVTVIAPAAATGALRERYAAATNLIVVSERQKGLAAAINQAWIDDDWSSTFTGWLGDDDALPPNSLRHAVDALHSHPRAVMVHGRCLMIDEAGQPLWAARNGWAAAWLAGYGVNLIAQPGCLFRTAAVEGVGGLDRTLKYAMDIDLYVRLRRLGTVVSAPKQLGVFREHAGGLSTAGKAAAATEARAIQRRALAGPGACLVDLAAVPITRIIGRASKRLPPCAGDYWRPACP